jgi:ABC-type Na+ efflux pump permease subunit
MKSLKSVLKFWQEIVFIIPIGVWLIYLLYDAFRGNSGMFSDGLGIITVGFHVFLLICLVGQFFWKNEKLSIVLTPFLLLYSLFWIFVSYAMPRYIALDVPNPNNYLRPILLIVALFLIFAAITMLKKYSSNENHGSVLNVES